MFKLNNDRQVPEIGFGTWRLENDDNTRDIVAEALRAGYRYVDTADMYENEEAVGRGLKASGLAREEYQIATKLDNDVRGYDETIEAFYASMKKLDLDYVDVFLIHWPVPIMVDKPWQEYNASTWKAFETLYEEGKLRTLGVSNFREEHYDALMQTAKIKPAMNQIKIHPGVLDLENIKYFEAEDILLQAYSPLGRGGILGEGTVLEDLATKYDKSEAQIALRWGVDRGYQVLPKSANPGRIKENIDIFDFSLTAEEIAAIDKLEIPK